MAGLADLGKLGIGAAFAGLAAFELSSIILGHNSTTFYDELNLQFPYDLMVNEGGVSGKTQPSQTGVNTPSAANKASTGFFMLFSFSAYNRPSVINPPTFDDRGSIALPLPSNLVDKTALDYSQTAMGSVVGAGLDSIPSKNSTTGKRYQNLGDIVSALEGVAGEVGKGAIVTEFKRLASVFGNNTGAGAMQLAGLAQNPFLSVLFNAPSFKRHVFEWTFIPENSTDSIKLKDVINKFKYHSLPNLSDGSSSLFLTYPDVVIPKIIPAGFMYDFKHCVVEYVNVNYAPGDTPGFQVGTYAPTAITLTISLLEIEYWLKKDMLDSKNVNSN